jgi:hypothetical protein
MIAPAIARLSRRRRGEAVLQALPELTPVVIHPPPVGYGEEHEWLPAGLQRRAFADNCLAGAADRARHSNSSTLKLVVTHLGGGICE